MKMYIAVLDEVPDFITPTLVAHTVLGAHLKFQDHPSYQEWLTTSFKKCVVRVNAKEFERISKMDEVYLGHENKTLGGIPTCAIPVPSREYNNTIRFSKLWKPFDSH